MSLEERRVSTSSIRTDLSLHFGLLEWDTIQSLCYKEQTDECAEFIRMMYTVRLKKVSFESSSSKEEGKSRSTKLIDAFSTFCPLSTSIFERSPSPVAA